MGSFKGAGKFLLLEGDDSIPFKWELKVSATSTDDEFIPYGMNANSVDVNVFTEDGTAVTSIVQSTVLSNNIITCLCYYPAEGAGTYIIKFAVKMDNLEATVRNLHDRIYAELNE